MISELRSQDYLAKLRILIDRVVLGVLAETLSYAFSENIGQCLTGVFGHSQAYYEISSILKS